mmetsp:Transcript_127752/g.238802  ORF Transcript_127752/g.238802 Transcript_127752/m.238802 type:complete len:169 (-) Transcript_127752:264-770(-)
MHGHVCDAMHHLDEVFLVVSQVPTALENQGRELEAMHRIVVRGNGVHAQHRIVEPTKLLLFDILDHIQPTVQRETRFLAALVSMSERPSKRLNSSRGGSLHSATTSAFSPCVSAVKNEFFNACKSPSVTLPFTFSFCSMRSINATAKVFLLTSLQKRSWCVIPIFFCL